MSCNCNFILSSVDLLQKAVSDARKQECFDAHERLLADKWQKIIHCYFSFIASRIRWRLTLIYSNWSQDLRESISRKLFELKNRAMMFFFSCSNLILCNLRFSTSASLMLFMTLMLRSFASLLILALTLTYLSSTQHSFAFDHDFSYSLWSLSQHTLLMSSRYSHSSSSSPSLVLLTWSIDELWLRYSFWSRIDFDYEEEHVRQRIFERHWQVSVYVSVDDVYSSH